MAKTSLAPGRGLQPADESGTGLAPEQEACLGFVLQRIRTGQTYSMGLQGYTRCGKTFLVTNHMIPELRRRGLELVVVDLGDVDRARRSSASEHQRLLYKAMTWAQRELHIMEG
jgi:hypothetical protein